MIQIGRFEPRNIGRDLEEMLEHRQNTADDCCGHDPVPDRERALNPEHFPVDRVRRKEIDGSDDSEGERQQPDRDADAKTGANLATPFPYLKCEVNRGESADQSADEQWRIDFAEQNTTPKTDEDRRVQSVVAVEQHAEQQRRERVGRNESDCFRPEVAE